MGAWNISPPPKKKNHDFSQLEGIMRRTFFKRGIANNRLPDLANKTLNKLTDVWTRVVLFYFCLLLRCREFSRGERFCVSLVRVVACFKPLLPSKIWNGVTWPSDLSATLIFFFQLSLASILLEGECGGREKDCCYFCMKFRYFFSKVVTSSPLIHFVFSLRIGS